MKTIRIGKDISVRWPILTNGDAAPLWGRDLTLFVKSPYGVRKTIDFSVDENAVLFVYPGTAQKFLGVYKLTLWENYGKRGQTAVDCCEAFELVACTCKEHSGDEGLDTASVVLPACSIEVGVGPGSSVDVTQQEGDSPTSVMSQAAVTRSLEEERAARSQADSQLNDKLDQTVGNINSLLGSI